MPKQYVEIAGRAMVAHTLAALARVPRLAATLVVLSPDDWSPCRASPAHAAGWPRGGASVPNGGAGLEFCSNAARCRRLVLVHDAARCLVRPEWVAADDCLGDAVGGLLALPVADTLKRPRAAAWPHAHRATSGGADAADVPLGMLRARCAPGRAVTDDSSAIEAQGLGRCSWGTART
jgi:2-C-methyl-D-erythritol 4-phosphate cytidylyltransferase